MFQEQKYTWDSNLVSILCFRNKMNLGLKLSKHFMFQGQNAQGTQTHRPLVKSMYQKINFLISQPKHLLWVLKRTVSMRRFF